MHIIFAAKAGGGKAGAGAGEGSVRERGPRDRTSFARDKLSTFFYYYCASMEFIPQGSVIESSTLTRS